MTAKRHPENERMKRHYLHFLAEVKGRDEASLDAVTKAIERFDDYNRRKDFKKFHIEQARGFKAHLMEQTNVRTGAPLSASTVKSTLANLKAFFVWLARLIHDAWRLPSFSASFDLRAHVIDRFLPRLMNCTF